MVQLLANLFFHQPFPVHGSKHLPVLSDESLSPEHIDCSPLLSWFDGPKEDLNLQDRKQRNKIFLSADLEDVSFA